MPEIARVIFASIDPTAHYLIVTEATRFTQERLLKNVPFNLVGNGQPEQQPVRDHTIYRVTETGEGNGEIPMCWIDVLVGGEYAMPRLGSEITVEEIWESAMVYVLARLEELPANTVGDS